MKNKPKNNPNEGMKKWARDTGKETERYRVMAERKTERLKKEGEDMDFNPSQPGSADRKKTECRAGFSHGRGNSDDIFWRLSGCLIK